MKILTRKKQDEILKRMVANNIIAIPCLEPESVEKFIDNSANIVYDIGGIKGLNKVSNTITKWIEEREVEPE